MNTYKCFLQKSVSVTKMGNLAHDVLCKHGLRIPNEGINPRYLKIGPMWQTKYASAELKNLGLGLNFRPCSEGYFLSGRP